ncbi:MAG TPA: ABC transporter permease [Candidatus Deferrimicrobiaceae bacterium]|jgi:putative ABC transport system permease protein
MIWNALLLAIREVRRNVLRSFLTILGIVIGVAAVIVMVTLGGGATAKVTEEISSLGSNMLMVMPGQFRGPGGATASVQPFKEADAEAVSREISSVAAAAPVATTSMNAVSGNRNRSTSVTGSNGSFLRVRNWSLDAGRPFTDSELRAGKAVCLVGSTVRKELFGGQDPVGATIRLQKFSVQVVGTLKSKGQAAMGQDQDDVIVIPLHTFQRRISGKQDVPLIQVSARDGASTTKAKQDLETLMRERRHLAPSAENDFSVMDMKELATAMSGTTKVLTSLLSAVATVSLLVGGIGIMNIMLVSVTERTREIGIRLAIGALEREVLLQFLVEAVTLSSLGGVIGIAIALASCYGLAGVLQVPFLFNPSIVVVALLFSAAVGVIFGYFPARKAAQLDPIEALRHE